MSIYTSEDYKKLSRKTISEIVGDCTPQYVGQILSGKKKDNSEKAKEIIAEADFMLNKKRQRRLERESKKQSV